MNDKENHQQQHEQEFASSTFDLGEKSRDRVSLGFSSTPEKSRPLSAVIGSSPLSTTTSLTTRQKMKKAGTVTLASMMLMSRSGVTTTTATNSVLSTATTTPTTTLKNHVGSLVNSFLLRTPQSVLSPATKTDRPQFAVPTTRENTFLSSKRPSTASTSAAAAKNNNNKNSTSSPEEQQRNLVLMDWSELVGDDCRRPSAAAAAPSTSETPLLPLPSGTNRMSNFQAHNHP